VLIAVENVPFYPDYYTWAARGFEDIGMFVQAAAIYRQALWALPRAPYGDAKKQKLQAQFQKKLEQLEGKIVDATSTYLPPPMAVSHEFGEVEQP
jgi:hypothetical protein